MVYRPTVRYDERFRDYVDELFQATTLDRNQIIRLGLFLLGHTEEGREILSNHLRKDTPLPSPSWNRKHNGLWLEKTMREPLEGETSEEDVQEVKPIIIDTRGEGRLVQKETVARPIGENPQPPREIRKSGGGIKIVLKP